MSGFDEMFGDDGQCRSPYEGYHRWFDAEDPKRLLDKTADCETLFRRTGITFNVYGEEEAGERLIPFDTVPRIMSSVEWAGLTRGIEQRVRAINAFLHDIYHRQEILRAGRIPIDLVANNEAFLPEMIGVTPPGGVYTHIVGVDIVRTGENQFYVLEDNARTPSGVSYMLENRETMLHMFPDLFSKVRVEKVSAYPTHLRRSLGACAPETSSQQPVVAVLTPGIDVLYRRVDDDFLDPLNFRPDSTLGVPGIMDVYRAGNITLANAPGTGIADDKAIYSYMPEIIEFYTGETAILDNVPTWKCADADSLSYVLDNLAELVVKEVHGSGGYGMLIGPTSSTAELEDFRAKLLETPDNYIAQPTLALSSIPILTEAGLAPRHVDLRPFVLVSPDSIHITPGGLTRVALEEGSLVVNSSQGGGTKDTWILEG